MKVLGVLIFVFLGSCAPLRAPSEHRVRCFDSRGRLVLEVAAQKVVDFKNGNLSVRDVNNSWISTQGRCEVL
jgi:hypothetical protein